MRLERVLAGIDFSGSSFAAARWAAEHVAPGAELVLLHVLEGDADVASEAANDRATNSPALAWLLANGRARLDTRAGKPHEVLREGAEDVGADLIVVGPHGIGSPASRLLGTTADRLIRTASLPVLVGPRSDRLVPPALVLGAVQDDDAAPRVLDWCAHVAAHTHARVLVVHVVDVHAYEHVLSMAAAEAHGGSGRVEVATTMEREGDRWRAHMAAAGLESPRATVEVTHGPAAERLLEVATQRDAGLMVLGRRDPRLGTALLGRTLRHVLHEAPCPVLVAMPPYDAIVED